MNNYGALIRLPDVPRLLLSVIPGRFAYGMLNLATFFYVQGTTGSLTLAGLATGAEGLSSSLTAGIRAWSLDRYGQTRPLTLFIPLWGACLTALSFAEGAAQILIAASFVGLSSPPINLSARPLWRAAVPASQLRTAYAIDTTIANTTIVAGPVLATAVALGISGQAALFTTAALMLVGGVLMISMPLSRNWVPEPNPGGALAALRSRGFRLLAIEGAIFGLAWGLLEIAIPASATVHQQPGLAAPLLATVSGAGVVGGLIVGARKSALTPIRGLRYAGLAMTIAALPLALTTPGPSMGAILAALGLATGFAQVYHWEVVEAVRPQGTATSAQAWLWTVEGSMLAVGAGVGGAIVEHLNSAIALAGTSVGLAASTAFVWLWLTPRVPVADRQLSDLEVAQALIDGENPAE